MTDTKVKNGKTALAEAIQVLIEKIKAKVDADALYKDADQRVKSSGAWKTFARMKTDQARAKKEMENADADVRMLALEIHAELGEKKPASGVQVIDKSMFEILDLRAAIAWCEENLSIAVVKAIDQPLIEMAIELMPEDDRPDFVKFETVQAVRISKGKLGKVEIEEVVEIKKTETEETPF